MARLIVDGTTGPWRYFHNPEHLFMVAGEDDPVEMLAGLYHDLLYVQVDRAIFLNLACLISSVVFQDQDKLVLRAETHLADDPEIALTKAIFDVKPGQILDPKAGQNEFLSALVAARVLAPYLDPATLAQVLACIELTIPFREPNDQGLCSSEVLYQRLDQADQRFHLGLGAQGCEATIHRAVRLTIRDLSGFQLSPEQFMNNTWCLLPEANNTLISEESYSIRTYRQSLTGTHGFFGYLDSDNIFPRFRDTPDEQTYQGLRGAAQHNLEVGHLYLTAKLAALGVLEAITERVGPETPISLLLDGLKVRLMPPLEVPEPASFPTQLDEEVFGLLAYGRTQEQDFDLANSPVAALFFSTLGATGIRSLYTQAKAYFDGDLSGDEIIAYAPPQLVDVIKVRILKLFELRTKALQREP